MSETRCTCGQGCPTFGACIRRKGIRVAYCQSWKNFDYTRAKRNDRELAEYKSARDQGIQPNGTQIHQTRAALDFSDSIGVAYDGAANYVITE